MELKEELPWETDPRSAEPVGSSPPVTKTMARTGKTRRPRLPGSFTENLWPQRPKLLRYDELPTWRRDQANKFVLRGYRPNRPEDETGSYYPDALRSWFYLHNESWNIHSHLWPAVAACPYALVSMIYDQQQRGAPRMDTIMCSLFFLSAMSCLMLSAMFHTMYECCYDCSQTAGSFWSKMDYVGITLLIFGSCVATTHFMFYCEPFLKWLYIGIFIPLFATTVVVVLADRFQGEDFKCLRALVFILLGAVDLVPILHFCISPGLPIENEVVWNYLTMMITMGLVYALGGALYGMALPERFFPGKVDYVGNAHSVFHALVLLGIVLTWRCIEVLFEVVEEGGFGETCVGFASSGSA